VYPLALIEVEYRQQEHEREPMPGPHGAVEKKPVGDGKGEDVDERSAQGRRWRGSQSRHQEIEGDGGDEKMQQDNEGKGDLGVEEEVYPYRGVGDGVVLVGKKEHPGLGVGRP